MVNEMGASPKNVSGGLAETSRVTGKQIARCAWTGPIIDDDKTPVRIPPKDQNGLRSGRLPKPLKRTVTVKLALPVLPCASVAIAKVTRVVPKGKVLPSRRAGHPAQEPSKSVKCARQVADGRPRDACRFRRDVCGTVTTGGIVSGSVEKNSMPDPKP